MLTIELEEILSALLERQCQRSAFDYAVGGTSTVLTQWKEAGLFREWDVEIAFSSKLPEEYEGTVDPGEGYYRIKIKTKRPAVVVEGEHVMAKVGIARGLETALRVLRSKLKGGECADEHLR